MTALSADRQVERYDGDIIALTVKAATTIYKGAAVAVDATGYAVPAADTAGLVFMGVAMEGAAAGESVRVYRRGLFNFAAAGMTIANTGAHVFASDDQTVAVTATNGVLVGQVAKVDSATSVWVDIRPGDYDTTA